MSIAEHEPTVQALIHSAKVCGRVKAVVLSGNDAGQVVDLCSGGPVSIGKSSDNQLVLRDRTVSHYHAELRLRRHDIEVRDLDSLNGTYVGDARIERAFVKPGSVLTIGAAKVRLESNGPNGPADSAEADELTEVPGVVAKSRAMREVMRMIRRLAPSQVSVLLHGETGTGKEVLARALHSLSERAEGPFEVVDCGSMAPTLIASELFGHERGAFTGAHGERAGAFERAHGGTLFLDEIGELPVELQPMLLGVLERRRFRRVGGTRERAVDVRVVSATHRDLRNATNLGTFRADLYFRLAVARVVVPPLRERTDDIVPLVQRFAELLSGDPLAEPFDQVELAALERHPWSGNVRELRNVVESAVALGQLTLDDSWARGPGSSSEPLAAATSMGIAAGEDQSVHELLALSYREARARAVTSFELAYLRRLSGMTGGNASEAARRAKMDRPYLLALLRKHGLR